MSARRILLIADLAGTAVFAFEGARAGLRGGLDVLGVLVLAFCTALGGGMIRDVLAGVAPPNALRDWRYPGLALGVGVAGFLWPAPVPSGALALLDAGGLALFAVAGAEAALARGMGGLVAVLLGAITATGGGALRDVLLNQVPVVLRADFYASAALAGALVLVAARRLGLSPVAAAWAGGLACLGLRLAALRFGWHLPHGG